eukprot:4592592-Pleurochrysis_carterae.AAC.1
MISYCTVFPLPPAFRATKFEERFIIDYNVRCMRPSNPPTDGKSAATAGSLLLNDEQIWTTTASVKATEC